MPDIDIDFADRQLAADIVTASPAMMIKSGKQIQHPSGYYLQNIPINPFTGLATIDYERAEEVGYMKIDFLNQSVYKEVKDNDHLEKLLNTEPMWELLDESIFVEQLPHIHNHFDVIQTIKPKSIYDLAVILALIRPGKRYLVGKPRQTIENEIWKISEDEYSFKKSHSISYAALIVVKMNLIVENLL